MNRALCAAAAAAGALLSHGHAIAQEGAAGAANLAQLSAVTVTATRVAEPAFQQPAAIDAQPINQDALGVNADESLQDVPGLLARNRQNYAQDEQLSIRGFGSRATFGIVDVRVYMDGIPSNQPDGQGELSQFNLASAERIEVLRGPFSALYGNSAGGVIQLFTAEGSGPLRADAALVYGSFNERRVSAEVLGSDALFSYNVGAMQFATDGARGHSAAQRTSLNGKWGLDFAAAGRLTLVANYFHSPDAQDPLGLTLAQFNANPDGTAPTAVQYNTRKSAEQTQAGAIYELSINDSNSVRLMGYAGHRDVLQFQAIPISTQLAPTSPGAVVNLHNGYGGVEPRWVYQAKLLGGPFRLTAGLDYDYLDEQRKGFNNYSGTELGVVGILRRDELDRVYDLDQFLQIQWQPWQALSLLAGLRHSAVQFHSTDDYIPPGQASGTGGVSYAATTPAAGMLFRVDAHLNLYGSFGDGFETPTLDELAYRPSGSPGLDFSLRDSRSHSYEVGAKLRWDNGNGAELALFRTDAAGEVLVASNQGGRSIYGNAGLTQRQGVELGMHAQLQPQLQLRLAYTYLDALVQTAYLTCVAAPCATPNTLVAAGNRIPGLPPNDVYAQLQWEPLAQWHWVLMDSYVADVFADDANTTYAGAFDVFGIASDYTWHLAGGALRVFVRGDNLLNRRYAGSVIVNATGGQYFEGGPGRSVLAGVSFAMR